MKTKESRFRSLPATILIGIVLFLFACGGGGGGGGSSPNSYNGLTTPAEINQNNAVPIAAEAYMAGSTAGSISDGITGVQNQADSYSIYTRSLLLSRAIKKAIQQIDIISLEENSIQGAVQSENGSEPGPCGGNISWKISVNDQTGNFSGNFNFNAYCEEDLILSGKIEASGKVNLSSSEFEQIHMTFADITGQSQKDSFSINGTIDMSFGFAATTATMNFDSANNNTGKVYRLENYVLSFTEDSSGISVLVSGKFYSPDYGYVTLSTQTPLMINYYDNYPYEGVLVCTGKKGLAGGSTKARLTVLSSISCEVEADTNGDGSYDWTSGTLYWSDL